MVEQDPQSSATTEVEQLSRLLGELAHEIKNPLSTIKVNLRLIGEELAGAGCEKGRQESNAVNNGLSRARRKLAVVQNEADRLEEILDGFLCYADRSHPQAADVDINTLVGDMVDFYSPQAHSHSITLRHQLHSRPLVCRVDGGMLKQAILNLFINAQQAIDNGGELMVRTGCDKNFAQIQISDTGTGIPPERISRIFDVFYSSRPHGTGLGLPTARKIIELHKGTITVASEQGKGTQFTIRLPLSAADKARQP
jgi:signal transduction histidine kinase